MKEYAENDVVQKSADVMAEAEVEPVAITQDGVRQLVMMSYYEFYQLALANRNTLAFRVGDTPAPLADAMLEAHNAYLNEDEPNT